MIDREKLVIAIERAKEQSEKYGLDRILVDFKAVDMILELLKEQPKIIRCKDCKHWSAERINDFNKCRRWINVGVKNFATMGDWYCADGESKSADEIFMEEMDADPLG